MKKQLNVKINGGVVDKANEKLSGTGVSMAFLVETLLSLFAEDKITITQKTVVNVGEKSIEIKEG